MKPTNEEIKEWLYGFLDYQAQTYYVGNPNDNDNCEVRDMCHAARDWVAAQ